MSGKPKFSVFRAWVQPSPSKNTNGHSPNSLPNNDEEQRQLNIKLAVFFTVVALLFVLAERLGRMHEQTGTSVGPDSTALVSLTLSPPQRSGNRAGFTVRFRLGNGGNHSAFYPLDRTTGVPSGQVVARTSPSSEWMRLSGTWKQRLPAVQEFGNSNLMWIEMPPGGWVDGEFSDPGESPDEHAYAIYVKTDRDAKGIRIVSKSYVSPRN